MKKIEIISSVGDGKLKRNLKLFWNVIKSFEGKTILITIKVSRKTRSLNQNAYYWGVIVAIWQQIIKDQWGEFYSIKEVHEFLKYHCNFEEKVVEQTGDILRLPKSTTTNTTTEQEEFHEKARRLALDNFNTVIPLPNEQINFEY